MLCTASVSVVEVEYLMLDDFRLYVHIGGFAPEARYITEPPAGTQLDHISIKTSVAAENLECCQQKTLVETHVESWVTSCCMPWCVANTSTHSCVCMHAKAHVCATHFVRQMCAKTYGLVYMHACARVRLGGKGGDLPWCKQWPQTPCRRWLCSSAGRPSRPRGPTR